jgi:hypothetical protein
MALIEVLDPSYVKLKLDNLDLSLTSLRDALRGANNKTLTDLDTDLSNIYSRLDVALSTRASETTLSGIKTQTDKLTFDASNYLQVNVKAIVNPPNLDVALSTRASESTLSTLSDKFPSAVTLADTLGNPTTTIIGVANLGWDGTYWRRLAADTSSRLRTVVESVANPPNLDVALSTRASESTLSNIYNRLDVALSTRLADSKIPNVLGQVSTDVVGSTMYALAVLDKTTPSRMPYMVDNISVGTTSSSTSIAAPGGKIVKITNKGDVDVLIGINADVPSSNPVVVRARTYKIFIHHSVTSIYYKVSSGSSVISIEWWN